jgi:hypothetical protein
MQSQKGPGLALPRRPGVVSGHEAPGSCRAAGGGSISPRRVHGTQSADGFAGLRLRRLGSRRDGFRSGERGPVNPERRFERVRRAAAGIVAADLGAGRVYAA